MCNGIDNHCGDSLVIFGRPFCQIKRMQRGEFVSKKVSVCKAGDYGADPTTGGMFIMIPSGDIVSLEERNRRLK